jgi:sortase (surface protein transpeptidase)
MAKLAAAIAAAVMGMTLGVGMVVLLGDDDRVPTPAAVPVSLDASAPPDVGSEQPTADASEDRAATPVRVVIPAIDVAADLVGLGLNDDQSMEVPNFGLAGWYEPGPRPGEPGPAVIAAHVDSVDGPDVFFRLKDLTRGDRISVELADGSTEEFVVRRSEQQLKQQLPVERIWNDTDEVVLRLITCGGEFDPNERSYESNVIVYAAAA